MRGNEVPRLRLLLTMVNTRGNKWYFSRDLIFSFKSHLQAYTVLLCSSVTLII